MLKKKQKLAVGAVLLVTVGAAITASLEFPRAHTSPKLVYVAQGYGGFVPATKSNSIVAQKPSKPVAVDPLDSLRNNYDLGLYQQVATGAQKLVTRDVRQASIKDRTQAAFAEQLLAYCAARSHNLALARTRFSDLEQMASLLPDKGAQPAPMGQSAPTLEAEAVFQHAVCTGALGDKTGAENEYVTFMRRFPDSPLLHAAQFRIELLNKGNMPPEALAVWKQAKAAAAKHIQEQKIAQALCGPECLAEILRRNGRNVGVSALAREMGTTGNGTSLEQVAVTASRYGFQPEGLALTEKGLEKQTMPLIALLAYGHYVIVQSVSATGVTFWDPDALGIGHGQVIKQPIDQWKRMWLGTTLSLNHPAVFVQTAER